MRPLDKSKGDNRIITLSPADNVSKPARDFPVTKPSNRCPFSISTLNKVAERASLTTASISMTSFRDTSKLSAPTQ